MKNLTKNIYICLERLGFRLFHHKVKDGALIEFYFKFPVFSIEYSVHLEAYLRLEFLFFSVYIRMPILIGKSKVNGMYDYNYGISFHNNAFWIHWGLWYKSIDMPWQWTHVRSEVMDQAGNLQPMGHYPDKDLRYIEKFDYTYKLNNGEIQERIAAVHVEEREWRWKWFKWLPYPHKIERAISVEFNSEVGESTGSWKGGVLGCGYEMLPGETPRQTLRRMEKERKF